MSETVFPPCPNWFFPGVLSCGLPGTIAYGSRNHVIICNHKLDLTPSDSVDVSIINGAHKERVTFVLLSTASAGQGAFPEAVASCGEDSVIKLWDVRTQVLLLEQVVHVGQSLVAMDWSRADPDLLVSVDKHGLIVFWNLHSNTVQKMTFNKLGASCLACCPHRQHIVAVGGQRGLVTIISSRERGQVIHRMRGHDEEVCALAWCPVDYNVLAPEEPAEPLLASGCKGRQVFVWRTGSDGRAQTRIFLPPHPFTTHSKFPGAGGTSAFYLCLLWPEPLTLITNAMFGEVLAWDLGKLEEEKGNVTAATTTKVKKGGWPHYVRLLHNFHSRAPYTLACSTWVNVEGTSGAGSGTGDPGSGEETSRLVWTISQDRNLVAYNLRSNQIVAKLPTFSSTVYCIAASALDPGRIGIGVGDAVIRIWNLNNTAEFEVACHWQRIKSKVLSLSWHPLKENVLAFATGEGRVGLLNATSFKPPVIFKMQHRGSIYSMCWGPFCYPQGQSPDKVPDIALYTCGSGEIFQFDPSSPDECSLYAMEMVKKVSSDRKAVQGSELLWKSDNSVFAVGLEDGSVHIFSSPHLLLLHSLYSIKKYIQMFAWHPESTATDSGFSPYCNWLAVAANEKTIRVFNCTPIIDSLGDEGSLQSSETVECCSVLNGHEDKVPCICWNPHIGGQLVSVSYDGTAQVWDVPSQTALVVFAGHDGSVFSCLWSPLDPDLVFTGGTDATLHAWRVSKQTYQPVRQLVVQKKSAAKRTKRAPKCEKLPQCDTEEPSVSSIDSHPVEAAESKQLKPKSLLSSLKTVEDDKMDTYLNACRTLLEHSGEETIPCSQHEDEFPLFALYSDRSSVCRLLDKEASTTKESAEILQHYEVWKGNITELLKKAAREKKLSALLVSLAPMASPRLWLDMCKAYADQLLEAGNPQKAASYLVACHRLEEAIMLLIDRDRFSDALVLAKCRGADPAIVATILRKWADKLVLSGRLEQAAERLVVLGELDAACQLYARSKHLSSRRFAALVASKAGLVDKAVSMAKDSLFEHLVAEKWDIADCILAEHTQLQPLAVLSATQRLVVSRAVEDVHRSAMLDWLIGACTTSAQPSLLLEVEACAAKLCVNKEQLGETLAGGCTHSTSKELGGQMWFDVSWALCHAWTAKERQQELRHLLKGIDSVYQTQLLCNSSPHMLLLLLCTWLAPRGPLADDSVFVAARNPACDSLLRSLRAYLCAALVFWLEGFLLDGSAAAVTTGTNSGADESCVQEDAVDDIHTKICKEVNGVELAASDCHWVQVCQLLRELVDDVVNDETVQFFKADLQIKKLAASLASAVASGGTSQGGGGDCALQQVSNEVCVEDGSCRTDGGVEAGAGSNIVQSGAGDAFSKLADLKTSKEAFETARVCAPNPYFMWFKVQNVCEALVAQYKLPEADDLMSQLAVLRSKYLD